MYLGVIDSEDAKDARDAGDAGDAGGRVVAFREKLRKSFLAEL